MKVSAWERSTHAGWLRLSARIDWEDSGRASDTLWLDWPIAAAEAVSAEPDAALLMAYPLAMALGEQRLQLEGPVSPRLADGARLAMAAIQQSRPALRPVRLEVDERQVPASRDDPAREAALCLSGGVDALAALHQNLEQVPADHPARYRRGLFVFGLNSFDFADGAIVTSRERAAWAYVDRLERFASASGLTLSRARTNLRALYPSFDAWGSATHDAHLAALGQAMRGRVRSLAIGSAGAGLIDGSPQHPLLVSLYSSHDLDVHGAQHMVARLDKLRRLVAWPAAIEVLRVCLQMEEPVPGQRNCGRCEKCLRTMLHLTLLGAGEAAHVRAAFAEWITVAAVERLDLSPFHARVFYTELATSLVGVVRPELVAALRRAAARALGSEARPGARPVSSWHRRLQRFTARAIAALRR